MSTIEDLEGSIAVLATDLYTRKGLTEIDKLALLKEMDWLMYRLRNLYFGNQEYE
jgi:hypothetical protein